MNINSSAEMDIQIYTRIPPTRILFIKSILPIMLIVGSIFFEASVYVKGNSKGMSIFPIIKSVIVQIGIPFLKYKISGRFRRGNISRDARLQNILFVKIRENDILIVLQFLFAFNNIL